MTTVEPGPAPGEATSLLWLLAGRWQWLELNLMTKSQNLLLVQNNFYRAGRPHGHGRAIIQVLRLCCRE